MNNQLTLPILAAYLPWKVTVKNTSNDRVYELGFNVIEQIWIRAEGGHTHNKLLLRPLSDLDKPLAELEGKTTIEHLNNILGYSEVKVAYYANPDVGFRIYPSMASTALCFKSDIEPIRNELLRLHFDIFGGLQAGWALNLNDYSGK